MNQKPFSTLAVNTYYDFKEKGKKYECNTRKGSTDVMRAVYWDFVNEMNKHEDTKLKKTDPVVKLGCKGFTNMAQKIFQGEETLDSMTETCKSDALRNSLEGCLNKLRKEKAEINEKHMKAVSAATDFLRLVKGQPQEQGCIVIGYYCMECGMMPKHEFTWFLTEKHGNNKRYSAWWCAYCGFNWKHSTAGRILGIQLDEDPESMMYWKAEAPPSGVQNFLDILKIASNYQNNNDIFADIKKSKPNTDREMAQLLTNWILKDNDMAFIAMKTLSETAKTSAVVLPKPDTNVVIKIANVEDQLTLRESAKGTQYVFMNVKACLVAGDKELPTVGQNMWKGLAHLIYQQLTLADAAMLQTWGPHNGKGTKTKLCKAVEDGVTKNALDKDGVRTGAEKILGLSFSMSACQI
jgi:hypothetical protein